MVRKMYHTQERREIRLLAAIPCKKENAWFGIAQYFWYYENDAIFWGRTFKNRRKYFEVYKAEVDCKNILDTVFNEEHYSYWIEMVEEAIKKFVKKPRSEDLSLKWINDWMKERNVYDGINGVMFQDISNNPEVWIIEKFQYKKRIQLAVYNSDIISNFTFAFEGQE